MSATLSALNGFRAASRAIDKYVFLRQLQRSDRHTDTRVPLVGVAVGTGSPAYIAPPFTRSHSHTPSKVPDERTRPSPTFRGVSSA